MDLFLRLDLADSNQFKFTFTMNHGGNVWTFDFLRDLTEQYKAFTELILLYPYFIRVSWQQIHNILFEFRWTYWLIYFGLLYELK